MNFQRGMTLLEMVVVMALLAGFFVIGFPSFINKKKNVIQQSFRQIKALNRKLDSHAHLTGRVYRWVIVIGKKDSSWWVEKASSLNGTFDSNFVKDDTFFKNVQTLPDGLFFESLSINNHKKQVPVLSGKSYVYYFPEGQFDKILLKIKGKKQYWSVLIDRLNGSLNIFSTNKNWQDFKQ